MTTINQMTADATARQAKYIERAAGQHRRHVRAGFAQIQPLPPIKQVSDEQAADFWLHDDPLRPLTTGETILFWAVVGFCTGASGGAFWWAYRIFWN